MLQVDQTSWWMIPSHYRHGSYFLWPSLADDVMKKSERFTRSVFNLKAQQRRFAVGVTVVELLALNCYDAHKGTWVLAGSHLNIPNDGCCCFPPDCSRCIFFFFFLFFFYSCELYFNIHGYRQERIGIQFPLNTPPLGVVLGNQVLIPAGCVLWLRAPQSPDLIWSCLSVCSGAFTPGVSVAPHPHLPPTVTHFQMWCGLHHSIFNCYIIAYIKATIFTLRYSLTRIKLMNVCPCL